VPSPDAFGASLGEAVGRGIANVALTEQEHDDQVFLMKQANQIGQLSLQYKNRIRSAKGENAFGLPEQVQSDWQRDIGNIQSQARTPRQRAAVDHLVDTNWMDINGDMQAHVANEREHYDAEQTDAFTKTQEEKAIAHATAPMIPGETLEGYNGRTSNSVQFTADSSAAAIQLYGLRNGKPREWIEQQAAAKRSNVYSGAIAAQLSQGNDRAAKGLYDRFGESLVGSDKVAIQKSLEVASTRGESQRIADDIQAKANNEPALTLSDAIEEAKTKAGNDAVLRDAAVDRVRNDWALRLQSQELREKQLMDNAEEMFENKVSDIDPGTFAALPPQQQKVFRQLEKQLAHDNRPNDNGDPFYALRLQAAADPKSFAKQDLRARRADVSDRDYDELIKLQSEILKGGGKLSQGVTTQTDVTSRLLGQLGIKVKDKNTDERALNFMRQLDQAVIANQQATGREVTPEQVEAIGSKLMAEITVKEPRSWWNLPDRLFSGDANVRYPFFEAPAPATERAEIIDALKEQGVTDPSDEQINDLWRRHAIGRGNAQ